MENTNQYPFGAGGAGASGRTTIVIPAAPPKEEPEQQAPERKYKGEDLPARAMLALTEAIQDEDLASRCKTADTKENVGKAVEQLLTFLAEGQGEDHLILALCCLAFAVEQQEEERYW